MIFSLLETLTGVGETKWGMTYCPLPKDLDEMSKDENRIYSAEVYSYESALALVQGELRRIAG